MSSIHNKILKRHKKDVQEPKAHLNPFSKPK